MTIGSSGTSKFNFAEDHELKICDWFLSWGWGDNKIKIKKTGFIKSLNNNLLKKKRENVFLVTATIPRYSYWMYSIFVSRQWEDYLNDQFCFVENLNIEIAEKLNVRIHPNDYGWCQLERWNDRFPELKIDNGQKSILKEMYNCKVFISTYNATTFLEAFIMDLPTIIFWNPNHWELRDSAIPYFEELKKVGIFHESPESAACFLNKIWDDVDLWWNGPNVRKTLSTFKKQFCDNSENIVDKIEVSVKEIIADNN